MRICQTQAGEKIIYIIYRNRIKHGIRERERRRERERHNSKAIQIFMFLQKLKSYLAKCQRCRN